MACLLSWIETHPGLAAWIQAVGAIVGIATTVVIFWRQSRDLRRQLHAGKLSLLDGILAIFEDTLYCLDELGDAWERGRGAGLGAFTEEKARLLQNLAALNQMALHEIQPYESMKAFLCAKKILNDCVVRLGRGVGPVEMNGRIVNDFRDWATEFRGAEAVIEAQAEWLRR